MPARRRKQSVAVVYRPEMPAELWKAAVPDVAEPGPDASLSEWSRWEQAVAGAYRAQEAARVAWLEAHAHLPVDVSHLAAALALADEPFDGDTADSVE
jgi:hypothetical protein